MWAGALGRKAAPSSPNTLTLRSGPQRRVIGTMKLCVCAIAAAGIFWMRRGRVARNNRRERTKEGRIRSRHQIDLKQDDATEPGTVGKYDRVTPGSKATRSTIICRAG